MSASENSENKIYYTLFGLFENGSKFEMLLCSTIVISKRQSVDMTQRGSSKNIYAFSSD